MITCDAGMFKDVWTLSVGQHVVATERVGFLAQLSTGMQQDTGGWGGFDLAGGGYEARVFFQARTRNALVVFRPPGMTWAEFERELGVQRPT